jgi:hypothetical protein
MSQKTASHPLVGTIVRDTTVTDQSIRYLVGEKGFMTLGTGDFTPYDSAFNGPAYFTQDAFVVASDEQPKMSEGAAECLDHLHYRYTRFVEATTPLAQADALVEVNNAMSDMISWHPDYQFEYEHAHLPWQRNTED